MHYLVIDVKLLIVAEPEPEVNLDAIVTIICKLNHEGI